MPNTFSQIYIQIVFAVKGRLNLIPKQCREELHKYITGIVQNREQKMLSVFCMPDHTHLLVGLKPFIAISAPPSSSPRQHKPNPIRHCKAAWFRTSLTSCSLGKMIVPSSTAPLISPLRNRQIAFSNVNWTASRR